MPKQARISLAVKIPKPLERDLRKAAQGRGRSIDSVIKSCLEDGLEQLWWEGYADDLIERVNKAHATPGLAPKQKRAIRKIGLTEFAGTVAAVTSKQQRGAPA